MHAIPLLCEVYVLETLLLNANKVHLGLKDMCSLFLY